MKFQKTLSLTTALLLMCLSAFSVGATASTKPASAKNKSSKSSKSKTKAATKGKTKASKSVASTKSKSRSKSSKTTVAVASKRGKSSRAERALAARRAREAAARRRAEHLARVRAVDAGLRTAARDRIETDDLAGEDEGIRQLALDALGNNPGTVVVMDSATGRILSMVNQAWAVGKPFKPCSTIKLLTSLAALREGIVDPDAPMPLGGYSMTMTQALARSNNEYFQELGMEMGYEVIMKYAHEVGFGEPTGINLPGESSGHVPTPGHNLRRMSSHGDGYGVTALQLACFTAAIANGGTVWQPQVLRTNDEVKNFKPKVLRRIDIPEGVRAKLIEGMLGAVSYGTARKSNAASLAVAGKTGSCNCDCAQGTKLGLFTSFIDPSNPGLVVAVITTGSAQRGSLASIVAGNIYNGAGAGDAVRPRRVGPMRVERDAGGRILLTNRD